MFFVTALYDLSSWDECTYLRIVLDFFENSPCSNLLHIGHCIPPSSHGCVGLVGGDMHLEIGYNSV